MSFRFFRRMKIAPGVSINLSKSGPSLSFGPRGAKLTVGPRGTRTTVGIPGTGISYTTTHGTGSKSKSAPAPASQPVPSTVYNGITFVQRITTPPDELEFTEGAKQFSNGNTKEALAHFENCSMLADSAFLAGWICLKEGILDKAEIHLVNALNQEAEIGKLIQKYSINTTVKLQITDEVIAEVEVNGTGARLALVEVYEHTNRPTDAISLLRRLNQDHPRDSLILLSCVELLLATYPNDKTAASDVVKHTTGFVMESPIHAAVLLYRSQAFRILSMPQAALQALADTLKKTNGYPTELLLALRYEKALVLESMGQDGRARSELEKIYEIDPTYEDVASRLGVS